MGLFVVPFPERVGNQHRAALGDSSADCEDKEKYWRGNGKGGEGLRGNETGKEDVHHSVHGVEEDANSDGHGDFPDQARDGIICQVHSGVTSMFVTGEC